MQKTIHVTIMNKNIEKKAKIMAEVAEDLTTNESYAFLYQQDMLELMRADLPIGPKNKLVVSNGPIQVVEGNPRLAIATTSIRLGDIILVEDIVGSATEDEDLGQYDKNFISMATRRSATNALVFAGYGLPYDLRKELIGEPTNKEDEEPVAATPRKKKEKDVEKETTNEEVKEVEKTKETTSQETDVIGLGSDDLMAEVTATEAETPAPVVEKQPEPSKHEEKATPRKVEKVEKDETPTNESSQKCEIVIEDTAYPINEENYNKIMDRVTKNTLSKDEIGKLKVNFSRDDKTLIADVIQSNPSLVNYFFTNVNFETFVNANIEDLVNIYLYLTL